MGLILIIGVSIIIFLIDIVTPLGVAGGVPHIVPVLLAYKLENRKAILFFAILGSVLTVLAFFVSPPGGEVWQVLANRFLALSVIWAVAIACIKIKSGNDKLHILTDAINQSPNPIAITDKDAKIEYVNSAFLQKTGYSEKELLGNTPRILKSGKHSDDYYRDLWETIRSGKIWKENIFNKRKNGTLYWESLQITPLKNAQGEITHFYSLRLLDKQMESVNKDLNTLSHTLDQVSQAVLMTDREGFIVYANPSFEKVTGYSLDEVLGMNPNVLKSGEQTPGFYEKLWETIQAGKSWSGELLNKKKNGEKYWERVVISPVYDDGNNISHFITLRDDITESKQIIKSLQISEKRFRTIFEEAPLGVALIDSLAGQICEVNSKFASIAGRTREEMITIDWMSITHPDDVQKDLDGMADLNAGKITGFNMDKRYIKPDGSHVWINMTIAPITTKDKTKPRHLTMIEDITKRKEAEKKHQASEVQLGMVTEAAEVYFWDWKIKTDEVIHDPRWIKFLGYSKDEFKNTLKQCKELIHPDDLPELENRLDDHIKGKTKSFEVEYRTLKKSGEWVWTLDKGKVLERDEDGRPLRAYGTFLNIQERKETEARMVSVQRQLAASEKLAGVGELAAGVSHEVLNPVNIISVHTQMLQRKTKDDANIQNFCVKVRHEIDRIQKIMGSLLAFSRKGDSELQKGTVRDSIENVLALVEAEYKLDNIQIVRNWCDKPVEILYDADKIRQVFLNLIHNAKHSMPDGGTITVGCKGTAKNYHQFIFSDTGKGMSEEVRLRIFEPFFTTKAEGKGTGLGLSVVHGIIEEHSGKIRVKSEEGKGTTFTISLPVA